MTVNHSSVFLLVILMPISSWFWLLVNLWWKRQKNSLKPIFLKAKRVIMASKLTEIS
ncbi:hypothetical protein [Peribacillus sp. NPDC056705]|uniref:hypothetical protein n=1 Tax=Peribacillus sp. NPDC056705 TaxID=3345918 RepID=UPI00374975EF